MLEKVGKFKNTDILLNKDYTKRVAGLELHGEVIDHGLGAVFFVISIVIFSIAILQLDVSNNAILLSLSIISLLYSFYLLRSHNEFSFGTIRKDLRNINKDLMIEKESELDITAYLSNGLLNELGRSKNSIELFKFLSVHSDIKEVLARLNISSLDIQELSNSKDILDTNLDNILIKSLEIAIFAEREHIDSISTFIALLELVFAEFMERKGVTLKHIEALKLWLQNTSRLNSYKEIYLRKRSIKPTTTVNRSLTSRYSPTLLEYSTDLTLSAIKGNVMFSLARDREIDLVIDNLSKSSRVAVLLIGESGVGKSTLIKSIGIRMVIEKVPQNLRDMRLVSFNFSKAFALSKGLDDYKAIIQKSLEEAGKAKNIILVIDDFNQFIDVRADFVSELTSLFSKAWEEYGFKIIATSNKEGFAKVISQNKNLLSLFSIVELNEPSIEVSLQVLLDKSIFLEKKYSVKISFEALESTVRFGSKLLYERTMPEKGIYILEKACIRANKEKSKEVTASLVEKVISELVGVGVGKLTKEEINDLENLEHVLSSKILGQAEAVKSVVSAIKRARTEIGSSKKPLASFLFYGPTGVGKTELAKTIAEVFYKTEKKLLKIDLSEYQEDENLDRLIGKNQNGNFTGGELTEFVRNNPYCVVILDEIEKAKPKVLDLFLQLLDEGYIVDGMGRKIMFTNTIIVATSNVASKTIASSLSEGKIYKEIAKLVEVELNDVFKIEFLNRFDKLVMFKPLLRIDIEEIANMFLKLQQANLKEKGIDFDYSKHFISELAEMGYNPIYGARSMRRTIQDLVESKLSDLIIKGDLKMGKSIYFESINDYRIS